MITCESPWKTQQEAQGAHPQWGHEVGRAGLGSWSPGSDSLPLIKALPSLSLFPGTR